MHNVYPSFDSFDAATKFSCGPKAHGQLGTGKWLDVWTELLLAFFRMSTLVLDVQCYTAYCT
jgi:hypothetical protein